MAFRYHIRYETACRLLTAALFSFEITFLVSEVESVIRSGSPTASTQDFKDFVIEEHEKRFQDQIIQCSESDGEGDDIPPVEQQSDEVLEKLK